MALSAGLAEVPCPCGRLFCSSCISISQDAERQGVGHRGDLNPGRSPNDDNCAWSGPVLSARAVRMRAAGSQPRACACEVSHLLLMRWARSVSWNAFRSLGMEGVGTGNEAN